MDFIFKLHQQNYTMLMNINDLVARTIDFRKTSYARLEDLRLGLNEDQWIQRILTNPTIEMLGQQVILGNLKYDNQRFVGEMPINRDRVAAFINNREDQNRFQHLEVQTILMEEEAARLRGENFQFPAVVCFVNKNTENAETIKPTFYVCRGGSTYVAALKLCKEYKKEIYIPIEIYVIEDWAGSYHEALAKKIRRYYDYNIFN